MSVQNHNETTIARFNPLAILPNRISDGVLTLFQELELYKFSDKKNREDVIALRWPRACLSCGHDVPETVYPRHGIIGKFYVDKKTTLGDRRHTQVLIKLPGLFYMCEACASEIETAVKNPPTKLEKMVETLHEGPWMEFIEVERSGHVRLPEGRFKERLESANPDGSFKKKKDNPMMRLRSGP